MSGATVRDTPTPGPWTLVDNDGEFEITAWQSETMLRTLATVRYPADARLMWAAPDLLAALRALMGAEWRPATGPLQYDSLREDAWAAADAAIAKAEGRADS